MFSFTTRRNEIIKWSVPLVASVAYYYFARVSNPFKPWLLMRLLAYHYGDPKLTKEKGSIDPYYGIHYITLKSIRTIVKGIPGKVCPVRTFTFALPKGQEKVILADSISLGHGDVLKVNAMPTAPSDKKHIAGGHKSYSPTNVSEPGHLDLTLKIYPDGVNSQVFDALQVGDCIGVSAPWPPPKMRSKRLAGKYVNLIAFGVGITEALEVAKAELAQDDAEEVTILYANRYKEDSFFRHEIMELVSNYGRASGSTKRFRVVYMYSREDEGNLKQGNVTDDIEVRKGRVSATVLQEVFNLPTSADDPKHSEQRFVVPGSQEMIADTWGKYLRGFEYNRNDHSLLLLKMFAGDKPRFQKLYAEREKKRQKLEK